AGALERRSGGGMVPVLRQLGWNQPGGAAGRPPVGAGHGPGAPLPIRAGPGGERRRRTPRPGASPGPGGAAGAVGARWPVGAVPFSATRDSARDRMRGCLPVALGWRVVAEFLTLLAVESCVTR